MSCPIRKSQRNGWRCFCKSSATPARGSSWRHAQVSIKLHRDAEALNLRLFNSDAEQPRRWKSFSNDSRPAVMNASHKSPLADSSLSAAGLSIFIRGRRRCRFDWNFSATKSNRCASSISTRRLPCAICARSIFCCRQGAAVSSPPGRSGDRPSLIEDQSGNVRDYVRERDLIIDIEPAENSTASGERGRLARTGTRLAGQRERFWRGAKNSGRGRPRSPNNFERARPNQRRLD